MQGSRGGIDLPESDITRVKNHLAKCYKKMGETAPGSGTDGAFGSGPARPHPQAAARPADLCRMAGIENATPRLLLGGVMPLWLGAGLADWDLHRRARIEDTAGRGNRPCTR